MHPHSRPPPTTFEYIEANAYLEPGRPALVQDNQSWNYQALYTDLVRVLRVLHGLGVRPGQRVAVGTSGFQAGLLLLIAAENLGAVTLSFLHERDPDAQAVFALADWVFSDSPQAVPAPARFVQVDQAFLRSIEAVDITDRTPAPRVPRELHEPQRISRTSGSTGRPRFMAVPRAAQEQRITAALRCADIGPASRVLVAGPLVINWQFARAAGCLRLGAAVLDLARSGLHGRDITHVSALPAALEKLLRELPTHYVPIRPVTVCTSGGFMPAALRERAARAFGGSVLNAFGMNEAGTVCDEMDAAGVGVLSAGVDVRIVDADGSAVPRGRMGSVAVRSASMVEGYLGDAAATQAAFRDGWFHTGDVGCIVATRTLRLAGRHDELVNAGGVKLPASEVEATVRALVDVRDCAVLATNLDGGRVHLGIALVLADGVDRDEAGRVLSARLDIGATAAARLLFLADLPRTAGGKVDRMALHALFAAPAAGAARQ